MDPFTHHEALHTTHVAVSIIEDQLISHPYYTSQCNLTYNKQLDIAVTALAKAYQECALEEYDNFTKNMQNN